MCRVRELGRVEHGSRLRPDSLYLGLWYLLLARMVWPASRLCSGNPALPSPRQRSYDHEHHSPGDPRCWWSDKPCRLEASAKSLELGALLYCEYSV